MFIAYFFNFYLIENKTSYKKKIYIIISRYNLTYLLTERTELNNFKDETNPEEEITSFRKQLQEKISKLNFKINKTNYTDAVLSSDPNFYSQNSEYITGLIFFDVTSNDLNSIEILSTINHYIKSNIDDFLFSNSVKPKKINLEEYDSKIVQYSEKLIEIFFNKNQINKIAPIYFLIYFFTDCIQKNVEDFHINLDKFEKNYNMKFTYLEKFFFIEFNNYYNFIKNRNEIDTGYKYKALFKDKLYNEIYYNLEKSYKIYVIK